MLNPNVPDLAELVRQKDMQNQVAEVKVVPVVAIHMAACQSQEKYNEQHQVKQKLIEEISLMMLNHGIWKIEGCLGMVQSE